MCKNILSKVKIKSSFDFRVKFESGCQEKGFILEPKILLDITKR